MPLECFVYGAELFLFAFPSDVGAERPPTVNVRQGSTVSSSVDVLLSLLQLSIFHASPPAEPFPPGFLVLQIFFSFFFLSGVSSGSNGFH